MLRDTGLGPRFQTATSRAQPSTSTKASRGPQYRQNKHALRFIAAASATTATAAWTSVRSADRILRRKSVPRLHSDGEAGSSWPVILSVDLFA